MDVGEASRQYQAALEHRRSARSAVEGCVSFDDELEELDGDVDQALGQVADAMLDQSI